MKINGTRLFKPWELKGHKANDYYWHKKYQEMQDILKSGKPVDLNKPFPEQAEINKFNEEDAQFWDFKHDAVLDQDGELARFKNKPTGQPDLFIGNLSGPGGSLLPCNLFPILADIPKDK